MARRLQRIPDYFTEEEGVSLVDAAPSYQTRMAFRIMLKTGLRVSEALALRRVDLRLDQDPPIIIIQADSPGNKARKGREVPVPADLLESLRDLASFHGKDRHRLMLAQGAYQVDSASERVKLGLDRAWAGGKRVGRPPALTPEQVEQCRRMADEGAGRRNCRGGEP